MEKIKQLISWLVSLSPFSKVIACIVILLLSVMILFGCGTTHAVVRTSDSGHATITITTNNPTSVQASPNVSIDFKQNGKTE